MNTLLPSILDVAQKYHIEFHTKSFGKKETLAKCPFCREDANKPKKHYLSLNTDRNIYKCWYCKQSGGVLDFEARLSGKSFNMVKQQYFGKRRRSLHPAFQLDPYQLDEIGWKEFKRTSLKGFQEKREEILQDWKAYVHDEMAYYYAIFMCIAHLDNQKQRQEELLEGFIQTCWDSSIPNMYGQILDEFLKRYEEQEEWAIEGINIGRSAWRVCLRTLDFQLETLLFNIAFLRYLIKTENKKDTIPNKTVSQQKVI